MNFIELKLNENILEPVRIPAIVSNSKGIYVVMVDLNRSWDKVNMTAVFQCGENSVQVKPETEFAEPSDMAQFFFVPDEVLRTHGRTLYFGIVGTFEDNESVVMPTQMLALGNVIEGAKLTVEPEPTPEPEPEPEIPEV